MTNLDMNATSSSRYGTVNTDGFDSWNSQDIVLRNWVVTCGDVSPPTHIYSIGSAAYTSYLVLRCFRTAYQ
jgi:hypothetical protein